MLRTWCRQFALAVVAALVVCREPRENPGAFHPTPIDSVLSATMHRSPGARASLDSLGPAQWQYLYVFGPYMSVDAMRRCVAESHGFETYGVDRRDDIYVLIFKSPKGVLSSMSVTRGDAQFSDDATARVYPRGRATFVLRRNRTGTPELAPADTTTTSRCT